MATKKTQTGGTAGAPKAKSTKASSGEGKKPIALQKSPRPSKELPAVVGAEQLTLGEVVSKVWAYIKQHELQNPANRREILADAKLQAVFGKKKVTMFAMNKHLARHLK